MNFQQAVSSGFQKYAQFSGRASRSEFWYWILFVILAGVIASLLGDVANVVVAIGTIVPNLAIAARRLHDIDKSGWWQLIGIIPLLGLIVLIVWYCRKGGEGDNRFGGNPLAGNRTLAGPAS